MKKVKAKHTEIIHGIQKGFIKNLSTPFNANGVKWEIHNHDPDINNPSCPHMHAIGKPWRLDLYTGYIYEENSNKIIGRLKKKILKAIWSEKSILKIILKERKRYEKLHSSNPIRYQALPALVVNPVQQFKGPQNHIWLQNKRVIVTTKSKQNSIVITMHHAAPCSKAKSKTSRYQQKIR